MNEELRAKLEEVAIKQPLDLDRDPIVNEDFIDGAEWLYDQGYQFTREDIIDFLEFYKFEFFKADRLLSQEDQISHELKKGTEIEPLVVDLWIKERSKQ